MILSLLAKKLYDSVVLVKEAVCLTFQSMANLRHVLGSFRDGIWPYGRVHFLIRNEQTGQVTCDIWHPNLVVIPGRAHIADQLADRIEPQMGYMAIGTGVVAVEPGDTALGNELDRNALDSRIQGTGAAANQVTYKCTWAPEDGTGAITESGIFNSPSAGQMLCRSVFPVKNKEQYESMVMTWVLTISA